MPQRSSGTPHKERLESFLKDEALRKHTINCSESELLNRYREAETLAREARHLEI